MTASKSPSPSARRPAPDRAPQSSLREPGGHAHAPESDTFSPEDYAVGQVIGGRFRVEHVIGIGSMGVVLAARHLELDERVAIKLIRADMQQVPGVLSRFAREAKAAATLKSDHVAQVFDVGTADGVGPFIVMEYLEGRDLAQVLELEGRLTVRRALDYVMQACEALAVAHSAGITHRDIKPENLFVTRQGDLERIKLLDFGISKVTLTGRIFGGELSSVDTDCLLGTPLYMSPEQIRSTEAVDHRTDIWSLGAVLYELLTARSAFVAESVRQVWTRILEASPAPLVHHCPEAPPPLQAVIDRCLEKDPERRFQNVAELAAALSPFAPSRSRLYAQRASSILGTKSDSFFPAPLPSPLPASSALPLVRSSVLTAPPAVQAGQWALPVSDLSAPPVFGRRSSRASEPKKTRVVAALAAAALLGALAAAGYGSRRVELSAARAGPAPGPVGRAWPGGVVDPPDEELSPSRSVLVESVPSGALVHVGGQAIGVTPLATLLPVGTQQLALSKPGHVTEHLFLQLDAAPRTAKAVRARLVLQPSPVAPARPEPEPAAEQAPAPVAPAPKATRSLPRRATSRRATEPARVLRPAPAAPGRAATSAPPPPQPAPPSSLIEAPARPRLLDEPPRARLVE